jgi:hypothetical protein
MATDHTVGAPPSRGSTILVNIGCTRNSSSADRNSVVANSAGASRKAAGASCGIGAVGSRVVIGSSSSAGPEAILGGCR